jgi:[ribosomal protein S5]-alanine N-acetyltransferase
VGPVPTLQGYSVRLRAPKDEELPVLFDWYNDPEVVAPFDRFTLDTLVSFRAGIAAADADPRSLAPRFVIERVEEDRPIGLVGYYDPHPVLETTDVWYVIGDTAARGRGFGKEAVGLLVDYLFHRYPRPRVGATCDVANVPSMRLLEGLGFRREGTLLTALFHHGAWHDIAVYGVTREEWAERSRNVNITRAKPG